MKKKDNTTFLNEKLLSSAEAASFLGIHTASIRNWVRHGYLCPVNDKGQLLFRKEEISGIKEKLISGEIVRLNKRANKSRATKIFIPDEYSGSAQILETVKRIAEYIVNNNYNISASLYTLSLNLLNKRGLITLTQLNGTPNFITANIYLERELRNWKEAFSESYICEELLKIDIPDEEDIFGLIYQSVLLEGKKARMGSYYTPRNIVETIFKDYLDSEMKFLDPCCGTGRFLLCAADKLRNPENIVGFDSDELAVRIARINLIIKYKDHCFKPNIFCYDTLNNLPSEFDNCFDLIASNPPWGLHIHPDDFRSLKRKYPEISSGESFSYFIRKGYDLLKKEGILSFILPESILNIRAHRDIRKFISENTSINAVHFYNNLFKNVFTRVIRFDIMKALPDNGQIKIFRSDEKLSASQSSIKDNPDFVLTFHKDSYSKNILEKAYSPKHITLKGQAEWALGIVTGDNKKFISSVKTEGCEEIYTGKEIARFKLLPARNYIKFTPELFQQTAPEHKYRSKEKLIYKFISNKLVFAYDNSQSLTLNSANILIPEQEVYPIKTILALFNSSLYQFIFQNRFTSIKILRSHLEALPLPLLGQNVHLGIENIVNRILNGEELYLQLDKIIYKLFSLNSSEINYLANRKL